jgi:Tfp pilus assembly protein PilN
LLPPLTKNEIRAARTNVVMVRYLLIILVGVLFLGGVLAGTYAILTTMKDSAQAVIDANSEKTSQLGSIQSQAQALQSSLTNAQAVLKEEVVYTSLLTSIANATPKGTVIDKLSLSPTSIGSAITLQAYAKSTEAALSLKDSYQSSSLFSNVSIQNISTSGGIDGYPVNVVLGVTINKVVAQ